jgi:alginate O-acetyltransferase complex protein AlgI
MLFHTAPFGVFLVVVVTAAWALADRPRARTGLLLIASYWFYASWDLRYAALIAAVTFVDFVGALWLSRLVGRVRQALVSAVVGLNLGCLGYFKYANFFLENLGEEAALSILLPVGISFFTFQGIAYVVDVHRGEAVAERDPFRFALFIAFFPQLVAGPIVRARELLPALRERFLRLDAERFGRALTLILLGLTKKVVLADYLAANLVDRVFDLPERFSSLEVLAAIYGYALQIYGDFSGYCDMAIGAALLLGIQLPENFDRPYAAEGIRDFWRRWHITLSTWLRDYLYVPLGGSRGGRWLTQRNLLITMALGGLWHGAAWTFVVWGVLHGLWLALGRSLSRRERAAWARLPRWLRVALTFHGVAALWIFFRAESFERAGAVFVQLFALAPGVDNLTLPLVLVIAGGLFLHHLPRDWHERLRALVVRAPAVAQAALVIVAIELVGRIAGASPSPFIYFQF